MSDEHPEVRSDLEDPTETVNEPAKVLRIGSMAKQLLEEVRDIPLDDSGRERLASVYVGSVEELSSSLSPDLRDELRSLSLPLPEDHPPTEGELRVAQAQLVGWLEGLYRGIQTTMIAQQLAARDQLDQLRRLPQGGQPSPPASPSPQERVWEPPGTYL